MRSITSSAVAHGFGGGERIARSVPEVSFSFQRAPSTGSTISWRIWRPSCSSRPRRGRARGERYESLLVGNYLSNRSRPLHVRPDGFAIGIESEAEMEGPTTRPPDET